MTGNIVTNKAAFDRPYKPISAPGVQRFGKDVDRNLNAMLGIGETRDDQAWSRLLFAAPTELTISSGSVTTTQALHTVAAESSTSDDLDTIAASNNRFVVLRAAAGDTITLRHGVGNIYTPTGANITLTGNRAAKLWSIAGNWIVVSGKLPQNNLGAFTDPGSGNDSANGYSIGSRWVNTTLDRAWVCLDATIGTAVWKLISPFKNYFEGRAAAATVESVGCQDTSGGGTLSNANASDDTWIQVTSAGSSGSETSVYLFGNSGIELLRPSYEPIIEFYIKTGSDISSVRYWIGLTPPSGAAISDADTLASSAEFIGFRFSTVVPDVGWQPVLHDGTTQNAAAAEIGTVQASTAYKLRIRIVGTTAYFSVNDSAEVAVTTNFPAISSPLILGAALWNQVASPRHFLFSRATVGW